MKISILLPILAAGASKRPKKNQDERNVERFVASQVTNQCLNQVPSLGGKFEATNTGISGAIVLTDYSDYTDCKHVVQADSSCQEIIVNYRSVAVEYGNRCVYDSFRFGWTGSNGFDVTPGRCSCFGDGCDFNLDYDDYYDDYYNDEYEYTIFQSDEAIGPDSFSVNSNTFTFYFKADSSIDGGHVIIDWECVEQATTTTDFTTTPTTTTSTTTTQGTTAPAIE